MKKNYRLIFFIAVLCFAGLVQALEKTPQVSEKMMKLDSAMQTFYQNPNTAKADEIISILKTLDPVMLKKNGHIYQVFFSEIFRQYPQKISEWSNQVEKEPLKTIIFSAAVYSKIPELPISPEMAKSLSPAALDSCYGGFFASGNRKYVEYIIATALNFPKNEEINLSQRSALWSLLSLMEKHPKIKEYFREGLKNSYPQVKYALAGKISEAQQKELIGAVLISDKEKDKNDMKEQKPKPNEVIESSRLKAPFFDFTKTHSLNYEFEYQEELHKLISAECKRRYKVSQPEADKLAWNLFRLKSYQVPRKTPDEAGFAEYLSMWFIFTRRTATSEQNRIFFRYALKLAQKYPGNLRVAQMIVRSFDSASKRYMFRRFKLESLEKMKIHPYLKLMIKGLYYHNEAWKHRGGGYGKSVSTHGWQSFSENLRKARPFFEQACREYPQAPEAFAKMIELAFTDCVPNEDPVVWLKRALQAQADYRGTISTYTWFSRPRWGGSPANLHADAREFLRLRTNSAIMAQNGLFLLQALLSEIPVVESFRYFSVPSHIEAVTELFEKLKESFPLDASQKLFWGTAALLSGEEDLADEIADSLNEEDLEFSKRNSWRQGRIPSLYWIDFPRLNKTLKNTGIRLSLIKNLQGRAIDAGLSQLKTVIVSPDIGPADKEVLTELYGWLKAKIDCLTFRQNTPILIRLCVEPKENMELIKELISMGANVNIRSFSGRSSPLQYALKNEDGTLLEILLKAGVDVNSSLGDYNHLDYAIRSHYPIVNIRRLLEAGADPNKKYRKTFTPLHAAYGNLEGTKLLVKFGAKLNEVSEFGQTPLDLAEKFGSTETAKFLRSKGAKRAREL